MAVQVVLSVAGPLPVQATFNAPGDMTMYIEVQGSVYSQSPNQMLQINIALDGQSIGTAQIFSNGEMTHRPLVPAWLPVTLTQGQHTLALAIANPATTSDSNDSFVAVLHY